MDHAERFRQLTCTKSVRANLSARSVRAAALTATAGFADFAIRIGSTAVLARLILPEHFGLIMMAMAVTAVADQLRELGLSSATVQQPEITHEEVTNLFWINVAISTALTVGICAASPLVSHYYHDPRVGVIVCVLASTLVFGGLTVQHQALLTRQLRLGTTSSIRLTSSVVSTLLAIGLAAAGYGYWALLWREVSRAAILAAGMWLRFPWIPGLPYWRTDVRKMLRFGANLTAANILGSLVAGTDRFLLGRFWGAEPVAMYRQAFQLVSAPTDQLLSPLYQVTQPSLSMLQNDDAKYRRFFGKVLTMVCMITMPLSLFVAVYANEITALLLGHRWTDSAPLLRLLSFSTFFKQTIGSTAFVPITRGNGGIYLKLSILQNICLVTFMAVGVHWGAVGIAAADIATTYLLIAPRLYYNFKDSPVTARLFFTTIIRPFVASCAMAIALYFLRAHVPLHSPVGSIALGCVGAAIVFGGVWLLIPGGREELRSLIADVRLALQRRSSPAPAEEVATVA